MMELLKKWLDGSINWKEEKKIRSQAQEDSFLADALEGLDTLPNENHTHNIQKLEQRLQARVNQKNTKGIFPLRAIAAAAILLLSAGIWWNMQNDLNQSTFAEKQTQSTPAPAKPIMKNAVSEVLEDESTTDNSIAEKLDKDNTHFKQAVKPTKELAVVQKELPTTIISTNQKAWSNDPVQETVLPPSSASSIALETIPLEDKREKEVETEASIIVMDASDAEPTPIDTEPIIEEVADGIAYTYEESIAASPAPAAMVEEPTLMMMPPSDAGVISIVAEPETNKSRAVRNNLSDTPKVIPVGGMEAFKEYIKINTISPEAAKAENIQGTVFLVFSLDTDGAIKEVAVTKSLHPAYDLEAIRLLKAGPKWISPVNVGYCEISFGLED